jgi:hypothetical protein
VTALAPAHKNRTAARIEVELGQIERLLDAQAGAPEHDRAPDGLAVARRSSDHGDDLLGARRIGGIAATFAARRSSGEATGQRGRAAAAAK